MGASSSSAGANGHSPTARPLRASTPRQPLSTALGVLGMPGFTAWYGVFALGLPKEVGKCQPARRRRGQRRRSDGRTRAAASSGAPSDGEARWLRDLGFDAVFNYREQSPRKAVAELAPDGIDIYFDNVGETTSRPRSVRCERTDASSRAARSPATTMPKRRRGRGTCSWVAEATPFQGFIITDHFDRFGEFAREATGWVRDGKLQYRETIVDGIENAPKAFLGLLRGENIGKMLVKVGPAE